MELEFLALLKCKFLIHYADYPAAKPFCSKKPFSAERNVDLPYPELPIRQMILFWAMFKFRSFKISFSCCKFLAFKEDYKYDYI
ncbi:hypothetical protein [Campylobacter concisus]|uniref:hypothetical protein n=1 Tax=Campylobacter concisus TaxID=199 RepID=UPI003D2EE9CD